MQSLKCLGFFLISLSIIKEVSAVMRITETKSEKIQEITIDGLEFSGSKTRGTSFVSAQLKGVPDSEVLYRPGYPEIPVIRLYVSKDVAVSINEVEDLPSVKSRSPLQPVQPPQEKVAGRFTPFVMNRAAYAHNGFYPEKNFEIQTAGSVHGKEQFLLSLYPLSYNAATNEYQLRKSFRVAEKITRDLPAEKPVGPDIIAFVVGKIFEGSSALEDYQTFKQELGYQIETIRMEKDVRTDVEIRTALKALYKRTNGALKYVLLIGDADDVPGHESTTISGITDHYYRAIDTDDYESDINGPDVGVGRLAVSTEKDLRAVVEKFKKYQRGEFKDESWLKEISFVATDDRYEVAEGTHNYVIETYTSPKEYRGMFPEENLLGGDQLYAITHKVSDPTVVDTMKKGRTIIDYSGHGANTYWAGPTIRAEDVRSLAHSDALPFVIANACITGDFRVDESFGETWQRHPQGAIMYWGSMDSTYWDEDDILERKMFDGIYKEDLLEFNQLMNYGLSENWKHYGGEGKSKYYWETYVTFGDPSLYLRTVKTIAPSFEGPRSIVLGTQSSSFKVLGPDSQPLSNVTLIAKRKSDKVQAVAKSDSKGEVSLSWGALTDSPGDIEVIARGPNLRWTSLNLNVFVPNQPYLAISDFQINQSLKTQFSAGDRGSIKMHIENIGYQKTAGGTLQLSSLEGPGRILRGTYQVPALNPGQSINLSDAEAFQFEVPGSALATDNLGLIFSWKLNEDIQGNFKKSLDITRPLPVIAKLAAGENGMGISPSHSGKINFSIQNLGDESLKNISFQIKPKTCLDSAQGKIDVIDLAPSEISSSLYSADVQISASCHAGEKAGFEILGSDSKRNYSFTGEFIVGELKTQKIELHDLALAIKDHETVTQIISVNGSTPVKGLEVMVDLEHTYMADLVISLISPSGKKAILRERKQQSEDILHALYTITDTPMLKTMLEEDSKGDWKLEISDELVNDSGTLKAVTLSLVGYFE